MRFGFQDAMLILRHWWEQAQGFRRNFKARPKTGAEALAETVAALDLAEAERFAAASWPAFHAPDTGPSLDGGAPAPYISGDGHEHAQGILALIVTEDELKFVSAGTVVAGKDAMRRILLINGAQNAGAVRGRLDMILTDPRGKEMGGGDALLGEAAWTSFLPPRKPGLYLIRFLATLSSGARIEARGLLTAVADEERR